MDGFRFDLMGLMDTDLLNSIQAALDERFGVGEKLLYGEPWAGGEAHPRPGTHLCTKDNLKRLDSKIGAFCDATRDCIKGNTMDHFHCGFVNGGDLSSHLLYHCVTGWAGGDSAYVQAPSQTISYLSCHDDLTLWDKLVFTLDPERSFFIPNPEVLRANRMAAALNFFCQGRPFLLAGEEFGRTKGGERNSYRSSPLLNRLDWTRAWEYSDLVDCYRGLIALRMQLPALCDKSAHGPERVLTAVDLAWNCVGVTVDNRDGSRWDKLLLLCNSSTMSRQLPLPTGNWQILADDRSTFRWQEPSSLNGSLSVAPRSACILGRLPADFE